MKKITDQNYLGNIAKDDKDPEQALLALEMINDSKVLSDIYKNANDPIIRWTAFEKTDNHKLLPDITIFEKASLESIISENELKEIKANLLSMSNPFTFKDLDDLVYSANVPKGGEVGGTGKNPANKFCTLKFAVVGRKVEVISISQCSLSIELTMDGLMSVFNKKYETEYSPKRLFSFYKPTPVNSTGINFEKFVVWETNSTPKNTYLFKNGKWHNMEQFKRTLDK